MQTIYHTKALYMGHVGKYVLKILKNIERAKDPIKIRQKI